MPDENAIREALANVSYPGFSRDIVSFGLVKGIAIDGDEVALNLEIATRDPAVPQQIYNDIQKVMPSGG